MTRSLILAAALFALAACGERNDAPPPPEPTPSGAPKSIFRPEFQAEAEPIPELLEPLEATILFPEGAALTAAAEAQLTQIVASPQYQAGGAITLGGHSDAGGTDAANLRVSQDRVAAVRDWLIAAGAPEERIAGAAFGEQNPVADNALPDGTPDEAGRAKNRRVDITIAVPSPPPAEEPSLAEELADESPAAEQSGIAE